MADSLDFFKVEDLASPSPQDGADVSTEIVIELKPPIDSLQPSELFKRVDHIILEIRQCADPNKVKELKAELVEALRRLKYVRLALSNLKNLNDKRANATELPENQNVDYDHLAAQSALSQAAPEAQEMKDEDGEDLTYVNPITKFPNMRAAEDALREQNFFAEHISYFAMLLIEMNDFKHIKAELSPNERDHFYSQVITTVDYGLPHKHLLFAHGDRIIAIVSVDDDTELMQVGHDIITLISDQNFDVYGKMVSTTLSIGAASTATEMKDDTKKFDFKLWLKKCEAGLHKAKSLNEQNGHIVSRCCIGKGDDASLISAISTVSGDSASVQKHKSSFSLLASAAKGPSDSMSSLGSAAGMADVGETPNYNATLSAVQLRSSLRLYDKLQRMGSNNQVAAVGLANRFVKQGAHMNFQNPRDKRNTLLMMCCIQNMDLVIRYICVKAAKELDFDAKNDDSYNAVMLAILHVTNDETVNMIAQLTKDKTAVTNGGLTAKDLATERNRTGVLDAL